MSQRLVSPQETTTVSSVAWYNSSERCWMEGSSVVSLCLILLGAAITLGYGARWFTVNHRNDNNDNGDASEKDALQPKPVKQQPPLENKEHDKTPPSKASPIFPWEAGGLGNVQRIVPRDTPKRAAVQAQQHEAFLASMTFAAPPGSSLRRPSCPCCQ